jgi:hypothetical protein
MIKRTPIIDVNTGEVIDKWKIQKYVKMATKARAKKILTGIIWKNMQDNNPQEIHRFLQHYGYSPKYATYSWKNLTSEMKVRFRIWYNRDIGEDIID